MQHALYLTLAKSTWLGRAFATVLFMQDGRVCLRALVLPCAPARAKSGSSFWHMGRVARARFTQKMLRLKLVVAVMNPLGLEATTRPEWAQCSQPLYHAVS